MFWLRAGFRGNERSLHFDRDDRSQTLDLAQKMTGAHGVAPVIWKEGKEKSWEGCRSVPFGSVRFPCRQQVVYSL